MKNELQVSRQQYQAAAITLKSSMIEEVKIVAEKFHIL